MTTIKKNTTPVSTMPSNAQVSRPAPPAPQAAPTPPVAPTLAAPPAPPAAPPDPLAALQQYVQQTVAEFDDFEVGLGADPALTPGQKRHALKFRTGGDRIIAQIGNLAQQQGLESPALNVAEMLATLGRAQALRPLADRVAAFTKHVDDVIFSAESDSLAKAQQYYALLQRRALTDSELATALAPVVTFFARKPKAKAAGELTRPQKKATAKAVKTLQKNAPEMLRGQGAAGAGQQAAAPAAAGGTAAGTAASAGGNGGLAVSGNGSGAAGPASPTGAAHS